MADKTEVQIKAAEKRLDSIERSIETLRKDGSSNDTGAQLKALANRVDALAASIKEINVQMVLKKDLKTATKLESDDRDREAKAQQLRNEAEWKSRADKETAARLAELKEQRAQMDKLVSEQMLNTRFLKLETEFGTRIKVLEALVAAAAKR